MSIAAGFIAGLLFIGSAVMLATPYAAFAPGLVLALAGFAVLWGRPVLGVIGLAALVSLEGAFPGQPLLSGAKLIGGASLAIVAVQLVLRKIPADRLGGNIWRPLLLFLAVYVTSFAASIDFDASSIHARQLIVGMVLLVVTLATRDRLDFSLLAKAIVIPTTATCALTLAVFARNVDGRAVGLMSDPNYFALLLAFALPLAFMLAIDERRLVPRAFWLGSIGLMAAGTVASDSRSGFLVMMVAVGALAWIYRGFIGRLRARDFGWLALAVAIILPLAAALVPASYVERIQSIALMESGVRNKDTSLGRRMSYVLVGVEAIKSDPVIGSGPGTYAGHYGRSSYATAFSFDPDEPDLFRRAHNTYLELLVDTGVLGGLCFVALVLCGLRNFWRAGRIARERGDDRLMRWAVHFGASYLSLCAFLVFLSAPNHKYLWMSLALSVILLERARRAPVREPGS